MLLAVEDLHAHYGKSHILHGVSLEVDAGEIVCLLGRNGVGKSTTLATAKTRRDTRPAGRAVHGDGARPGSAGLRPP